MRKRTFLALFLLVSASGLRAYEGGDFGAGLSLGDPTGFTAKYWLNRTQALDVVLGLGRDFALHADYLWHSWKVFPQPSQGKLGGYAGLGAGFKDTSDDNVVGVRGVGGVTYAVEGYPLEMYGEIAPVLRLAPDTEGEVDGAVGIRFYFTQVR